VSLCYKGFDNHIVNIALTWNDRDRDKSPLSSSEFPSCDSSEFQKSPSSVFEYIFTRYSKLHITNDEDRPVAIAGLEARLERFYGTRSVYGILGSFFRESLFWHRAGNNGLVWNLKLHDRGVPTWSWMAYIGEIGYIALPTSNLQKGPRFTYVETLGKCALQAPLAQMSWNSHVNRNGRKNCEILDSGEIIGLTFCDEEHDRGSEVTEHNTKDVSCICIAKGTAPYIDGSEYEELKGGGFLLYYTCFADRGSGKKRQTGLPQVRSCAYQRRAPFVWGRGVGRLNPYSVRQLYIHPTSLSIIIL